MVTLLRMSDPDFDFDLARSNLECFVQAEALRMASHVGFNWRACVDAPSKFDDLSAAYECSRTYGFALPISSANNENSVYGSVRANIAFRFWHDCLHVQTGLTFDLRDELALARFQVLIVNETFGQNSLEGRIVHFDLAGQVHYLGLTASYPANQLRFVRLCLDRGLDAAILTEYALSTSHVDGAGRRNS